MLQNDQGPVNVEKNPNPTVLQPDGCKMTLRKTALTGNMSLQQREEKPSRPLSLPFEHEFQSPLLPDSLDVKLSQIFIAPWFASLPRLPAISWPKQAGQLLQSAWRNAVIHGDHVSPSPKWKDAQQEPRQGDLQFQKLCLQHSKGELLMPRRCYWASQG